MRRKIREFNGILVSRPKPTEIRVQTIQPTPTVVPRLSAIRPSSGGQIHLAATVTSTMTSAKAHSPYSLNGLPTTPNPSARVSHPLYSNRSQVLNLRRDGDPEDQGEDYQPPTKRPFLK